ncbi:hypothetical protein MSAR_12480 [Mycolicibacterium sarraceniae]|uniref:EAL domain-containing protein n=1 Tax=Mycolicibacterium sarraceniae TaxID=1534348 RepID=A0A7I7SMD3_9MYCO|nr:hypothetical protein MSAR_12480 [Mycolicibacterium sarraceniae]
MKFDRHFIASVAADDRAAAVVSAVIELNHNLGITVVAETAAWLSKRRNTLSVLNADPLSLL